LVDDKLNIGFDEQASFDYNQEKKSYFDSIKPLFPKVAGFLLILAGIVTIFFSFVLLTVDNNTLEQIINTPQLQQFAEIITVQQLKTIYTICGSTTIIIAIISILGGICAIKKRQFLVAIIGSVLGLFTILYVLPGIIYIAALLLLILSRKEFQ
jgi:hypothetical protein